MYHHYYRKIYSLCIYVYVADRGADFPCATLNVINTLSFILYCFNNTVIHKSIFNDYYNSLVYNIIIVHYFIIIPQKNRNP